jgi:hypothetical protein
MASSRDTDSPRSGEPLDTAKDPLQERNVEKAIAELSSEFAQRVGALADLFESWRKPAVARTVIGSLIAGDTATFGKLSQSLNWEPGGTPRPLGKCFYLRELVDKIVESRREQVCRLSPEFSSEQRSLYFLMVMEARRRGWPMVFGPEGLIADRGRQVIGGPDFLDALVRAGLVTCKEELVADISGLTVAWGPPSRVCV